MRTPANLFALPISLLLFVPTYTAPSLSLEAPSPRDLPPHIIYSPEEEVLARRHVEIQNKLAEQRPRGVKKMPANEGEMFFLEYWLFEGQSGESVNGAETPRSLKRDEVSQNLGTDDSPDSWSSASIIQNPLPPLLLHTNQTANPHPLLGRYFPPSLSQLARRDFVCPNGTSSCTSIDQPNSCCQNGLVCITVPDTGHGAVACCADGSSCGTEVASCQQGYTSCPSSEGGGCCIPGFECVGGGCVFTSTVTVAIYQTVTASIPTSTSTSTIIPTTTIILPLSTTLSTSTPSPSTSTPTSPSSTTTTTTTTSTTTSTTPPPSTSTTTSPPQTPLAPLLGTSAAQTLTLTSPSTITICPTGFYQCSAYYAGGACCQVGRDCSTSSCPPHTTSTALVSDGITIINAPTAGAAVTGGSGSGAQAGAAAGVCATGWFLCQDLGEGCCPSGYTCAGVECLAGAGVTGAASVGVEAASSGAGRGGRVWWLVYAGVGAVVLWRV